MNKSRATTLIFGVITLIIIMVLVDFEEPWVEKTIRYDMDMNVISEQTETYFDTRFKRLAIGGIVGLLFGLVAGCVGHFIASELFGWEWDD